MTEICLLKIINIKPNLFVFYENYDDISSHQIKHTVAWEFCTIYGVLCQVW